MDWQMDFVKPFLGSVAAIVGAGLLTYLGLIGKALLPAIQAWAQSKGNSLVYMVTTIAVKAAEQRLDVITGADKLKYVEDFLTARGIAFDRTFVEAAVHDLNAEQIASGAKAAPVQYTTGIAQVGTMVAGTPTVTTTSQAADTQG